MIKNRFLASVALLALSFTALPNAASAEQWYFYVQNSSGATLKQLLVSEDGSTWNYFDIGSGIQSGSTSKLVWSQSTNNQSCNQFMKATFSDGTESQPQKFNFCKDLDTPIVYQ